MNWVELTLGILVIAGIYIIFHLIRDIRQASYLALVPLFCSRL